MLSGFELYPRWVPLIPTVAWSPHTNKGIDCVESVQHRAARFVNSDYSRYSSVSSMLTDLHWPTL